MKKIAMAVAGAALALTLAAPAGAAVASPTQAGVSRYRDRGPHECYDRYHRQERHYGNCYDSRHPQHDGGGSILY